MRMRKWLYVSNNVILKHMNSGINGLLLLLIMACSVPAMASVIAERTRIIFSEGSTEESLQLVNSNSYPVAVQVWVDDGDLMATPEKAISPVLVLPPLFRLQPQAQRSLRLILSGASKLPTDRESAFWLNVYEIPPKAAPETNDESFVTLALRMQYKVFYRPKSLLAPSDTVGKALTFTLVRNGDTALVRVDNPTPYYASLASLALGSAEGLADMVAPFSKLDFPLNRSPLAGSNTVNFDLIDDLGNRNAFSSDIK
ncbi:fimbrial biogenesis chaperone [Yersinia pekkanenii]|uniref:Pilus chaperone, PapD family n=1 Tax=Yersinia pekkanenii TaxID=1288385 RepID=A0A0T9NT00_9GAMM|nr:molecular chaperone [Yersinia pekkanenii]CNH27976.1 putative pilus chaperone%2C PapD family [Yersinia pekkanenii]CRY67285.1 putative pilus chaperone%2C PapD family [Yersinia pekkanenii]